MKQGEIEEGKIRAPKREFHRFDGLTVIGFFGMVLFTAFASSFSRYCNQFYGGHPSGQQHGSKPGNPKYQRIESTEAKPCGMAEELSTPVSESNGK